MTPGWNRNQGPLVDKGITINGSENHNRYSQLSLYWTPSGHSLESVIARVRNSESRVGSITSRCSGKWARTKTGLERAAEIKPNSFAYFLTTKEYLTAGSTVITATFCP